MRPKAIPARVWVTRTEPGAWATARRLEAAGYTPIVAPLLRAERLPVPDSALAPLPAALILTSPHGVEALHARLAPGHPARRLRVYAVGEATAAAARAAGFDPVLSADGDREALAQTIETDPERPDGALLFAGADIPAGDLPARLAPSGILVRHLALYATRPCPVVLPAACRSQLKAVLLQSPRAARVLADAVRALETTLPSECALICLSDAVATPLRDVFGSERIAIAATPTETDLMVALTAALSA
ncbi:MAG: uroporphyrinogen-III synthase [Asticcacaulis sp.]